MKPYGEEKYNFSYFYCRYIEVNFQPQAPAALQPRKYPFPPSRHALDTCRGIYQI